MRLFNIEIEMEKKIRNMIQAAPLKLSNPSSVDWEVISQAAPAFKSMHSKDNGISEACHPRGPAPGGFNPNSNYPYPTCPPCALAFINSDDFR